MVAKGAFMLKAAVLAVFMAAVVAVLPIPQQQVLRASSLSLTRRHQEPDLFIRLEQS